MQITIRKKLIIKIKILYHRTSFKLGFEAEKVEMT